MFEPDHLASNAYRALGVTAEADAARVHGAASSALRAAALGLDPVADADLPGLGKLSRTEATIRMALGRVQNPQHRIRDRLFWFHASPTTSSATDAHPGTISDHDAALLSLLTAMSNDPVGEGARGWLAAIRAFAELASRDDYWLLCSQLEERCEFEPRALPSEINALRNDAVRLAAEGYLMAVRDALSREDTSRARLMLEALFQLRDTGPWAVRAIEELTAPSTDAVRVHCDEVRKSFISKVSQARDAASANALICADALKYYRAHVQPALAKVAELLGSDDERYANARQEAAIVLVQIAVSFSWADDAVRSEELTREALEFAPDAAHATRLKAELPRIEQQAQRQRVAESLRATLRANAPAEAAEKAYAEAIGARDVIVRGGTTITEEALSQLERTPAARERNLGVSEKAIRSYRREIEPAIATLARLVPRDHAFSLRARQDAAGCLAMLASTFSLANNPMRREQLSKEALALAEGTPLAKEIEADLGLIAAAAEKQRMFDALEPISSAPTMFTVNGVGFKLYFERDYDAETNSHVSTHYLVFAFIPIFPIARYRVIAEGSRGYRFLGRLPLARADFWHQGVAIVALLGSFMYCAGVTPHSAEGRSAREVERPTPSEAYAREDRERQSLTSQIEGKRAELSQLRISLQPTLDQIKEMEPRIEGLEAELHQLDVRGSSGRSVNPDAYNAKVRAHNRLVAKHKALVTAHQSEFDKYDRLRREEADLVQKYNWLPGSLR